MKTLLSKVLEAIVVLVSIFILGVLPSVLISLFACAFTDITFSSCVTYPPFWIVSLIGWIVSGAYIDHVIKTS